MARLTRKFGPSDRGNPFDPQDQFLWVFSHDPLLYVSLTTILLDLLGVSVFWMVGINVFVFFGSLLPADETPVVFSDYECELKLSMVLLNRELGECPCEFSSRLKRYHGTSSRISSKML